MNLFRNHQFIKYLLAIIVLTLVGFGIINAFHFPISWDLQFHHLYGKFISYYLESGTKNRTPLSYGVLIYYGGIFDTTNFYFSKALNLVFDTNYIFEYFNILIFLSSLIGIFSVYKISELLINKKFGLFSVVVLLLIPEYFNHIFMNPKDIPFASFYGLSIYLMIYYFNKPKIDYSRLFYMISVTIGIAIGIRILGIVLILIFGTLFCVKLYFTKQMKEILTKKFLLNFVLFGVVLYSTAAAFWPYIQKNSFSGFMNVFHIMSQFPWNGHLRFQGELIPAMLIGRTYIPVFFANTFPDYFLLMIVISLGGLLFQKKSNILNFKILVLIVSLFFPLLIIIGLGSNLYNGLRQVLFMFLPLTILTSYFFWHSVRLLKRSILKNAICFLLLIGLLDILRHYILFHPYYYVYFNRSIAGGLENGARNFDTDYWSLSSKEAAYWIKENHGSAEPFSISVNFNPVQLDYWLNPKENRSMEFKLENYFKNIESEKIFTQDSVDVMDAYQDRKHENSTLFQMTRDRKNSDLFVTTECGEQREEPNKILIHQIERNGIVIGKIYKNIIE